MNFAARQRTWRSLLALLFLSLATATVSAATITVMNNNDSGVGSLRQAILDNATMGGGNTIVFSNNVIGTIELTNRNLIISNDVTIVGPGSKLLTVSGNGTSLPYNANNKVFRISGNTVSISGLRIFDGKADTGAGIYHSSGNLILQECDVVSNTVVGAGQERGGGIYNTGVLILERCAIRNNDSGGQGGGIYNGFPGTVIIRNSTISQNNASLVGGGIYSSVNTTIRITSSNIVSNNSYAATTLNSGGILGDNAALFITNSIVAGNYAGGGGKPDIYTFGGTLISGGYNIIGNTNGNTTFNSGFIATNDQRNVNPMLGPLADSGGTTLTHAPLSGSPAIDRGKSFGLTTDQRGFLRPYDFSDAANAIGGDGSDIGAVEFVPFQTLSIVRSENYVVISWPADSPPSTLQSTTNLPSTNWVAVPESPTVVGDQFCVTNSAVGATVFYRLRGN